MIYSVIHDDNNHNLNMTDRFSAIMSWGFQEQLHEKLHANTLEEHVLFLELSTLPYGYFLSHGGTPNRVPIPI